MNARLVVDFNGTAPRFRFDVREGNGSLWLARDSLGIPRPMVGTSAYQVYQLDDATRSVDGQPYTAQAVTSPTHLGYVDASLAYKIKEAEFLELWMEVTGNDAAFVNIYWDGQLREVLYFVPSTGGAVLGSAVLGAFTLAAEGLVRLRRRLASRGVFLALGFSNAGTAQNFSVARALLYFHVADEGVVRAG
jgi:hypothetical protein